MANTKCKVRRIDKTVSLFIYVRPKTRRAPVSTRIPDATFLNLAWASGN
jgi:hypothetical protein